MNKLVYQVAVEHFQESVDTFRDEMLDDAFVGGSSFEFLNTLSDYEGVPDSALNIKFVRAALQALVRYAALMLLRMYVSILVLVSVLVWLLVSGIRVVVGVSCACACAVHFLHFCTRFFHSCGRALALDLFFPHALSRTLSFSHALLLSSVLPRAIACSLSLRMGTLKSSKQMNPNSRGEARYFIPDTEVL